MYHHDVTHGLVWAELEALGLSVLVVSILVFWTRSDNWIWSSPAREEGPPCFFTLMGAIIYQTSIILFNKKWTETHEESDYRVHTADEQADTLNKLPEESKTHLIFWFHFLDTSFFK